MIIKRNPVLLRVRLAILAVLVFAIGLAGGCAQPEEISIICAEQYGLAYAPIQIMKEKGYLEQALAGRVAADQPISVSWVKLANTAAIREAMLAESLDVAFVAIPPFLIGVDQGMPWKMITGLSDCPLDLMVQDVSITDLSALVGAGKIALPQPGSIQHILLAMAAEKQLGDFSIFDRQLISMKHPDGMQALLSGRDIAAHFTAPPYNFMELEAGGSRSILTGQEAMGEAFSFIVGIAQPAFFEDQIRCEAFMEALDQSFDFIAQNRAETVALLSASFELSPEKTEEYLYERGIIFGSEIRGTAAFSSFMARTGYIGRQYDRDELVWQR